MKKHLLFSLNPRRFSVVGLFIFLLLISFSSFSQTDCGNNAGFESGNTNGWVCLYGTYGIGQMSPRNCPDSTAPCYNFPLNVDSIGIINANGMNAPLNTGQDRHTIMTMAYNAGGPPGMDSISDWTVPVVPPGGGTYSFRLGDGVQGSVGTFPNRLTKAEAIRLSFNVDSTNSAFTYRYAAFIRSYHYAEEQPRFEVVIKNSSGSIIPGGFKRVIPPTNNAYCDAENDTSGFLESHLYGWLYKNWTDTKFDLSAYIGQTVSVEFRTTDCFYFQPGTAATFTKSGVTTTCSNVSQVNGDYWGICCWGSPQVCTTISSCSINIPGSHSSYAYVDAYCSPLTSVKELMNKISLRIYPNPVSSTSVLELSSPLKDAEIIIYDVLGNEMLRKRLDGLKTEIRKEDLKPGIYFVNVNAEEKQFTQKIIIE